jgi:hypothetical protein
MYPTTADGIATPTAITRYQKHIQHLLDYTYMKSSLGKNPTSAQRLVEQTYHQSSLGKNPQAYQRLVDQTYHKTSSGNFSRMTQTIKAAKAAQAHYNSPPLGNLSRTTRLIQASGFGPH